MSDLYRALKALSDGDGRGVLAEVLSTEGSTPRKAGARMLLTEDGDCFGAVGGGSLEYYARREARRVLEAGQATEEQSALGGGPGEDIDRRLHCPIGLPIHAETPEEIAVSIAAELIGIIRGGGGGHA